MKLAKALETTADLLEAYPALLWQYKPEFEDGLNCENINRLMVESGREPIITQDERTNPDPTVLKKDRFVQFTDTTGERLEILTWNADHLGEFEQRRRLLQIKRAVAILREWATMLQPVGKPKPDGKKRKPPATAEDDAELLEEFKSAERDAKEEGRKLTAKEFAKSKKMEESTCRRTLNRARKAKRK